ncbi:MAG TPA: c-type cytochrome [Steroidobacteraceae bacterium]|nr:c-type cytochrome [Steroidobacteraceae bacterium]
MALTASSAFAGQAPATFPAQQRPPGDPALIERGGSIYGVYCRSCHGPDLRGGDLGGPNLLRSPLVLNDQAGEVIGPVIRDGRVPPAGGTPMPPMPMADGDVRAVAAYLHSVLRSAQPQGAPPRGAQVELNLLVGNAGAGERYFASQCAGCHSTSGDLAGIGTRLTNIEQLQNSWVAGRRMGSNSPDPTRRVPRVTVKFADGRSEAGSLLRLDDFVVSYTTAEGQYRSHLRRSAGLASVQVDDPLLRHRQLWSVLSDKDMHDVTAYLASIK